VTQAPPANSRRSLSRETVIVLLAAYVALPIALLLAATGPTRAAQYGTAEEAKAMLEKAVSAVKEDKAKALDMFNNGEGGFKDRDLYVACANASDGAVTAHPYLLLQEFEVTAVSPMPTG
jgi:hypothetical protein